MTLRLIYEYDSLALSDPISLFVSNIYWLSRIVEEGVLDEKQFLFRASLKDRQLRYQAVPMVIP